VALTMPLGSSSLLLGVAALVGFAAGHGLRKLGHERLGGSRRRTPGIAQGRGRRWTCRALCLMVSFSPIERPVELARAYELIQD